MDARTVFALVGMVATLGVAGCDFEVPLTATPTRKIDERLLGTWGWVDKDSSKEELMGVRKYDETTFVVSLDADIYRAFHSDFAGQPFVSVQDLNSGDRKYCYYTARLSADGDHLTLHRVGTGLVPDTTRTTKAVQQLIKANLANPALFQGDEMVFTRKKPGS